MVTHGNGLSCAAAGSSLAPKRGFFREEWLEKCRCARGEAQQLKRVSAPAASGQICPGLPPKGTRVLSVPP